MKHPRRIVILAEAKFSPLTSKTANQAIRYIPEEIVGVIDSTQAGRTAQQVLGFGGSIPVIADLRTSLQYKPDTLLIGIAPTGGRLPEQWRSAINEAILNKLRIISGLHSILLEDEEFKRKAMEHHAEIIDLRKVSPEYEVVSKGLWKNRKAKTILTIGTDCNAGKMTASLELHREFVRRGLKSDFVATGQTGILLSGRGFAVDSIISDYVAGGIEHEIELRCSEGAEFIHVEGQGSIAHQGYSSVTLGLLHGTMPDAMIMVHHPLRVKDDYGLDLTDVNKFIRLNETVLEPFRVSKVVGIAVNTAMMTRSQVNLAIHDLEKQTGLPAADVLTPEVSKLVDALIGYLTSI